MATVIRAETIKRCYNSAYYNKLQKPYRYKMDTNTLLPSNSSGAIISKFYILIFYFVFIHSAYSTRML